MIKNNDISSMRDYINQEYKKNKLKRLIKKFVF